MTQQNAAMVEESNASSATLSHQAQALRDLVAQFNIGPCALAAPAPAPARKIRTEGASALAPVVRPGTPAARTVAAVSGNVALKADSWEEF